MFSRPHANRQSATRAKDVSLRLKCVPPNANTRHWLLRWAVRCETYAAKHAASLFQRHLYRTVGLPGRISGCRIGCRCRDKGFRHFGRSFTFRGKISARLAQTGSHGYTQQSEPPTHNEVKLAVRTLRMRRLRTLRHLGPGAAMPARTRRVRFAVCFMGLSGIVHDHKPLI